MKKFIIWPEEKVSTLEAISFWVGAGYIIGKDFDVIKKRVKSADYPFNKYRMVIKAKTQMILAQDALQMGFVIAEL